MRRLATTSVVAPLLGLRNASISWASSLKAGLNWVQWSGLHLENGNPLLVKRSVDVIWENCIWCLQFRFSYRLRSKISKPPFLSIFAVPQIAPAVPQVHQQTGRWRIDHTPCHSMTGQGQDGKAFFLSKLGVEVGTANAILLSVHLRKKQQSS